MSGSDLFTGTLDVLILKALSAGPSHGYAVAQWIRESSEDVLKVEEGALYPALHRLERKKLLKAEWGLTTKNREAKFYRLTAAGRKQLQAEVQRWADHAKAVSAALETVSGAS